MSAPTSKPSSPKGKGKEVAASPTASEVDEKPEVLRAGEQLRIILNGPVMAGVGATVDAGLTRDMYHLVTWEVDTKTNVRMVRDGHGKVTAFEMEDMSESDDASIEDQLKLAIYNVEVVYDFDGKAAKASNLDSEFTTQVKSDMIAILSLMIIYGYHGAECRTTSTEEDEDIEKVELLENSMEDVFRPENLNRAATFILARCHTKYQTNHAIGGTPMQGAMASTVRAFYGLSEATAKQAVPKAKVKFLADALYWALHPVNEILLMPLVIKNCKIDNAPVFSKGPVPDVLDVEEYFAIRTHTPPASTHHFYVAAASIRALDPMGILPYLPEPHRMSDVTAGLQMIDLYGAALHPAANFWGLTRVSSNQKLVEPICADLGYAVRKLIPASSLAESPILQKEDALNTAWKSFIDALRASIDEQGKDLMSDSVFKEIAQAIAPSKGDIIGVSSIKGYLTTGKYEVTEEDAKALEDKKASTSRKKAEDAKTTTQITESGESAGGK